jgi:hypothetical protein
MQQKNDSNAEAFAEIMQKAGNKLYGYSAKPDAEKYGYEGLTRIIYAAEVAQINRFDSLNPPTVYFRLAEKMAAMQKLVQYAVQSFVQMYMQTFVQYLVKNFYKGGAKRQNDTSSSHTVPFWFKYGSFRYKIIQYADGFAEKICADFRNAAEEPLPQRVCYNMFCQGAEYRLPDCFLSLM